MNINEENKALIKKFIATAEMSGDNVYMQSIVIGSECGELEKAVTDNDIIEVIDGFADVIFASEVLKAIDCLGYGNGSMDEAIVKNFAIGSLIAFIGNVSGKDVSDAVLNEMLREVCVSNMSKFDHSYFDANFTKKKYIGLGIETSFNSVDGLYVTRSVENDNKDYPHGKVLKSAVNYKPPCFDAVINKLGV